MVTWRKVRLISRGRPVYQSLAAELESINKHWIRELFWKIHVLDRIDRMSEEQRAEAPELFRGIGGEAIEPWQFAPLRLGHGRQRYATQDPTDSVSRGICGIDDLHVLGGDLSQQRLDEGIVSTSEQKDIS